MRGKFFQFSFCWNAAGNRNRRPHPFWEAGYQFSTCVLFAFLTAHPRPWSQVSPQCPTLTPSPHSLQMTPQTSNGGLAPRVLQSPWLLMNSEQDPLGTTVLQHTLCFILVHKKKSHQIKQFIMCLLRVWRYVRITKHHSVNQNLRQLWGENQYWDKVNCVKLKLLLHYMVLLNMAMFFPVLDILDAKDASLPSTISCHVNLICSHFELLTSKQDHQNSCKYFWWIFK